MVDPKVSVGLAKSTFKANPIGASLSGLGPRLVGVGAKRIPKFGALWAVTYALGGATPGLAAATAASMISAPFINPVRMIEPEATAGFSRSVVCWRAFFRETGRAKPILEIVKEARAKSFKPLFRGTLPLCLHSLASATTGLVGQPQLQKYIQRELGQNSGLGSFACNLIASSAVTPIYVLMTNPASRLEVIMQTNSIAGKSITLREAIKEMVADSAKFGFRGIFRGQGIGMVKGIISLSLFHQGRLFASDQFKERNIDKGWYQPKE